MTTLWDDLKSINNSLESLVGYYNAEFNGKMTNGKLIFKTMRCGKKGCKFCPHGPYWYRAVFNKKTKRYMFQYVSSKIKKSDLKWYEVKFWDRIKFYDAEANRLRSKKRQVSKAIRLHKMGSGK